MNRKWIVVGGGLVGLSTARSILAIRPEDDVIVLDKESRLGVHQSGRNSGVVHSGVNYAPGSLKAQMVREGRRELIQFCQDKKISIPQTGKWVAADDAAALARMADVRDRADQNGESGVETVGVQELREREPNLRALGALWVPSTRVVDYGQVLDAYAQDFRLLGGQLALGSAVNGIEFRDGVGTRVTTASGQEHIADFLVVCGGLQSDRLARKAGLAVPAKIVPFAGHYHELTGDAANLLHTTVYPVPDPRLPFLGVHFTLGHDNRWTAGPNAVLSLSRESYSSARQPVRDGAASLGYRGTWRMAASFWRDGVRELSHHLSRSLQLRAMRRFVPDLNRSDLVAAPERTGVRAQAVMPNGTLVDDFLLLDAPNALFVMNAPSPAATASMAIGRSIADRAVARMSIR